MSARLTACNGPHRGTFIDPHLNALACLLCGEAIGDAPGQMPTLAPPRDDMPENMSAAWMDGYQTAARFARSRALDDRMLRLLLLGAWLVERVIVARAMGPSDFSVNPHARAFDAAIAERGDAAYVARDQLQATPTLKEL